MISADRPIAMTSAVTIPPGGVVRLDATATVDAALGNVRGDEGQRGTVGFQVRATLTGDDVANKPKGALPPTGADVGFGVLIGSLTAGAGIVLLLWRRRRNGEVCED